MALSLAERVAKSYKKKIDSGYNRICVFFNPEELDLIDRYANAFQIETRTDAIKSLTINAALMIDKTNDTNDKSRQLALAHWQYVESVLRAHGANDETVMIAQFHYITAFEHGYKHGLEDTVNNKPTLDDLLTASGKLADAAGAVVGESLGVSCAPCNALELSQLLSELKDAVNQYNAIVLARMNT